MLSSENVAPNLKNVAPDNNCQETQDVFRLSFHFLFFVAVLACSAAYSLPPFSTSSSSMAPPRVLLCGDVLGRLNQLFKRVATVSKSAGPFDVLLCVGQFFPDSSDRLEEFLDYTEGRSQVPIPTYFIGDYGIGAIKVLSTALSDPLNRGFKMDGLKICDNLYWLKGSGKFTLHGLNLTYLSGKHLSESKGIGTYNQDDVDALRAWAEDAGIVDLFLTNQWPSGVTNRADISEAPPGISESSGSDSVTISELVAEIKPRYHIAGTKGVFYAREPYSNKEAVHVTRFFGLAPVGNKDKQKFIHAISPTPASTMSADEISGRPPNTTLSPYTVLLKTDQAKEVVKQPIDSAEAQYWRYDVSKKRQRKGGEEGEKLCFKFIFSGSCPREEKCNFQHDLDAREQFLKGVCIDFLCKGKCERGPDCTFKHNLADKDDHIPQKTRRSENTGRSKDCWFCLSSPNVESHLILGIGENYYFALAKGPLVEDHVLIIPIEHSPNTLSLEPIFEIELEKFKNSLKMYFKNQSKEVVFFEWVSKHGTHANLQAIPIPLSKTPIAQRIFNLAAEKLGFKFVATKSDNKSSEGRKLLRAQFDTKSSLFYVELPEGTILSHSVEDTEKFPAQFGREVLAGLLNMADRADWRNCKLSKEEEMKMAEGFKKRFEEFDPTR